MNGDPLLLLGAGSVGAVVGMIFGLVVVGILNDPVIDRKALYYLLVSYLGLGETGGGFVMQLLNKDIQHTAMYAIVSAGVFLTLAIGAGIWRMCSSKRREDRQEREDLDMEALGSPA